ncbi:PREDICTED: VEGF coregulated chemokine 1 [Chrysochloris asiatica]|uniref:VEGF coregulated chemokine 1 n=1 Tax=Chrysochloris asiatica TaxID=185453 RepID=A0A9B0TWW4_CHRAS|nr:PREDICTED: VEGF coregulated chemokine 1 [Chrysochloris asiatica]
MTCFLPTGVARGHKDQLQGSRRWLQVGGQECECKENQRHHRKLNKHSRACQQFLQRCHLASFALPI